MDREPKLGWKTVELTDTDVAAHLSETVAALRGTVMLANECRFGRKHLRLRKDGKGYFVTVGSRGHDKRYLGRCKVTYFDGIATLFQFTTAVHDEFEAEQDRRWADKHGVAPLADKHGVAPLSEVHHDAR